MIPEKLHIFAWERKAVISICYFCDLPREKEWQCLSFPVKGHISIIKVHQVTDIIDNSQSVCAEM